MDALKEIQQYLKDDLLRLDSAVRVALTSESELLNSITDYYLKTKGKQLRPLMVLLTARLLGDVNDLTIHGATAIELLHNASLIHDDVVDESNMRRGRKTINSLFDNKIAVLVGDFFVSCSLHSVLNTQNLPIIEVLSVLGKELSKGEINQLSNAESHLLSEERYMNMIGEKTASLFVACLKIGAISTGATPQELQRLAEVGYKMGLCFQIKDDIFDYGVGEGAIGKPMASDIKEGKVTLPLLYAAHNSAWDGHSRLLELLRLDSYTPDEVAELCEMASASGGIDYAEQTMQQLSDEVRELLAPFADKPECAMFLSLMSYIINRDI